MKKLLPVVFSFFFISFFKIFSYAEISQTQNTLLQIYADPHLVLRALMVSYPNSIQRIEYDYQVQDWYISMGKTRLYWAEGRLLPIEDIQQKEKWRPLIDYVYPNHIPDPKDFTDFYIDYIRAESQVDVRENSSSYHPAFYDALYDGLTRRKIESQITRFDYLGLRVSVHHLIVPALKRVETKLYKLACTDKEVADFISSIGSIDGYNWREIADSPVRSNHSWGIAIDILPKNWGQKNIYWNWIAWWNKDWMLIPLDRRWMPPLQVIKTFEEEGFIWGGKWHLWDNMHFEYRPELITLQKWDYKR